MKNSLMILQTLLFTASIIASIIFYNFHIHYNSADSLDAIYPDYNIYLMSDTLDSEQFSTYFQNRSNLIEANSFVYSITNSNDFYYHYANPQSIGIDTSIGISQELSDTYHQPIEDTYVHNGTEYMSISSVQFSEEALNFNNLSLETGDQFQQDDFKFTGDYNIPVILGDEFGHENIELGDSFEIEYIFESFEAEVIGILEENQTAVTTADPSIDLSEYIIMPAQNYDNHWIENNFEEDYDHDLPMIAKISNGLSSLLVTELDEQGLTERVNNIGQENRFTKYNIMQVSSNEDAFLKSEFNLISSISLILLSNILMYCFLYKKLFLAKANILMSIIISFIMSAFVYFSLF